MNLQRFEVVWADVAIRDLDDIVDFVALEAPMAAQRLFDRITKRSISLETLPARGRIVPELGRLDIQAYRELIIPPHRLMYRVESKRVVVVAVVDARRDLEEILMARLLRP